MARVKPCPFDGLGGAAGGGWIRIRIPLIAIRPS
jgi:hypothetical protein